MVEYIFEFNYINHVVNACDSGIKSHSIIFITFSKEVSSTCFSILLLGTSS